MTSYWIRYVVLRPARSARLGFSQDFADTVLPRVLSQFTKLYPLVQVELHIEGNAALVDGIAKGTLDVALAVGQADQPTAEVVGTMPLVWIAGQRRFSRVTTNRSRFVVLSPNARFGNARFSCSNKLQSPGGLPLSAPVSRDCGPRRSVGWDSLRGVR